MTPIYKSFFAKVGLLILAVSFFTSPVVVVAADSGFIAPNQTVTTSSVDNPNNAWVSDNNRAIFNSQTDSVDYGFPSFSIPVGATIDGIEVAVEGRRNPNRDVTVALWNTSAAADAYSSTKTAALSATTNDNTSTLGSSNDKWGKTWAISDFDDANFKIQVHAVSSGAGDVAEVDQVRVKVYYTPDTTAPTVTINQKTTAPAQIDPTTSSPINFTVVFSESVSDFTTGDITLSGTAGATTATVTGSGTTYNVAVSGMTSNGTIIAAIAAGKAHDGANNANTASTSTDNTVTYNGIPSTGTLNVVTAVHNDDGGTKSASDFTIQVTGASASPASFAGSVAPHAVTVTANASFSTAIAADAGYFALFSPQCSTPIAASASATCTVTIDDIPAALPAGNLIPNPSLEMADATVGGTEPQSWSHDAYLDTATFSYPTQGADSATGKAAKVQVTGHVAGGDAKWFFDPITVAPDSDYVYHARYKSDVATHVILAEVDGSNNYTFTEVVPTVAPSAGLWGTIAFEIHTKPTTVKLSIYHAISAVGTLEIDRASLVTDTALVITDLVPNNSFEQASVANPEVPRGWTQAGFGTNTRTFDYVNGDGHNSTRSAKVTVSGYTDGDAKWMFTPQALAPGEDYTFTGWYKTNTVPHAVAQFNDASGNVISFLGMPNPQPAANSTTQWQEYTGQFSVPSNAASVTVFFFLSGNGWVQVDDFHITSYDFQGFNRPLVTLTFDDGFEENVSTVLPVLNGYILPSTQCFATQYVANLPAQEANVLAFYDSGHEICDHTVTHRDLTTLSSSEVDTELSQSKSVLEGIVGAGNVTSFASPFGAYNAAVNAQIAGYFASHRTVDEGYNSKDNLDVYRLRVQNMKATTTLAEFEGWVNKAIADKTWLIIVYHKVTTGATDEFDASKTNFDAQMAWLNGVVDSGAITAKTMSGAIAEVTDVTPPVITIAPYSTTATNLDITVTASTNEGTLNATSHLFTENGSFDFIATDDAGNTATTTVTISNIDKTAPVIAAHADVSVFATDATGALVTYDLPSVSDNADEGVAVACVPVSGTLFSLGSNPVTCSATDNAGNAAVNTTFNVVVADGAPVLELIGEDEITIAPSSAYGETEDAGATAIDAVDGDLSASILATGLPVNTSVLGDHLITYTVTDTALNVVSKTRTIKVVDGDAPIISEHADVTASIDTTLVSSIAVTYDLPTATDAFDGALPVSCDPVSGSAFALGSTEVTCSATDSSENEVHETFQVIVADINAPVATGQSVSTDYPEPIEITLTATDGTIPAQTLAYGIVSGPSRGTLSSVEGNTVTYTPSADFFSGADSFTFKANDGDSDSNIATVSITVRLLPTCDSGTLNGNDCDQDPISACPSGTAISEDGTTCESVPVVPFAPNQCPDGFTLDGDQCVADPILPTAPTCPEGTSLAEGMCVSVPVEPVAPTCESGTYNPDADQCETPSGTEEPPIASAPTCPVGAALTDDQCVFAPVDPAAPSVCPDGFTLDGDQCVADPIAPVAPTCPEGVPEEGGMCVPPEASPAAPSCPSGTTDIGGGLCQPAPIPAQCIAGYHVEAGVCEADVHYAITASAGANGTISPIGTVDVIEGGSQSFTITANSGYHIAAVLVDGVSAGTVGTYQFISVSAAHTIAASFAKNSSGGGGGGSKKSSSTPKKTEPAATAPQVLGESTSASAICSIYIAGDISIGEKGDAVMKLQSFLNANMKAGLTMDGQYGAKTIAAVKAFQLAHADKIPAASGIADGATVTLINEIYCASAAPAQVLGAEKFIFTQTLKYGSSGSEVMELQKKLIADGFMTVAANGHFGPATKAAVIAFQKAHGLAADGIVGALTRAALNK